MGTVRTPDTTTGLAKSLYGAKTLPARAFRMRARGVRSRQVAPDCRSDHRATTLSHNSADGSLLGVIYGAHGAWIPPPQRQIPCRVSPGLRDDQKEANRRIRLATPRPRRCGWRSCASRSRCPLGPRAAKKGGRAERSESPQPDMGPSFLLRQASQPFASCLMSQTIMRRFPYSTLLSG